MSLPYILDDYDLEGFLKVAAAFGTERFGYVVTPNVDHLIRFHDEPVFRALYADAAYVLMDSRFLSIIFRVVKAIRVRVCTGSDLTAQLFARVIAPDDRIVLIGGDNAQASSLADRYGLRQLRHFNPPMGFIRDPREVEKCIQFIEECSPFRFCFLAVGAPQQEVIANKLKGRGIARGMALCIGAAINFLTGGERRAPAWMQRMGLEWLYRLVQDPGRLARRYLVRGPRVFLLLPDTDVSVRPSAIAHRSTTTAAGGTRTSESL
jgi:N-acetylglucosaminyldiphosphoundecaprenol N-acetyl-beta-D-mannosaminyltransferase